MMRNRRTKRGDVLMDRARRDQKSKSAKKTPKTKQGASGFVLRLEGVGTLSKRVRTALQKMNLVNAYNGVFLDLTEENKKRMQLVEPYIAYGCPSMKTTQDLILKHGFTRSDTLSKRTPLSSNVAVEDALGEHGLICVEDVAHELHTCGGSFEKVNEFLWPFQFKPSVADAVEKRIKENKKRAKDEMGFVKDIDNILAELM